MPAGRSHAERTAATPRALLHDTERRHDFSDKWAGVTQVAGKTLTCSRGFRTVRGMDAVSGSDRIELTPYAVEMVKRMRAKEGLDERHALRVAVVGGGCSGFSYQLDFDDSAREGDLVLEFDGVQVRVDPTSLQYIEGLRIDYVSSLHGGGFKFSNPRATHTCGCGSSFSA